MDPTHYNPSFVSNRTGPVDDKQFPPALYGRMTRPKQVSVCKSMSRSLKIPSGFNVQGWKWIQNLLDFMLFVSHDNVRLWFGFTGSPFDLLGGLISIWLMRPYFTLCITSDWLVYRFMCPFQIAFSRHRYSHAAHKSMLFKVSKCSVLYKEWKITSLRCKISVWGAGTALLVRGHHFRRDPGGCTVSQGAALLWTPRSNVSHGAALLWTPRGLHCQPKGQRSMLFNAQSTVKVEWG